MQVASDSNIKKMEDEKLEKSQGLKEELERVWGVKTSVVHVVMGALGAVTPSWESGSNKSQEIHVRSLSRESRKS